MPTHRHDQQEWAARKAAHAEAAAQHGQGQNVPALRARIDALERARGIVPATATGAPASPRANDRLNA